MSPEDINHIAQSFQAIITGIGIIVAGIWSYYVFFYGRTFAPSVRIEIKPKKVSQSEDLRVAIVTVTLRNEGKSRVRKKSCRFFTEPIALKDISQIPILDAVETSLGLVQTKAQSIFRGHAWLEPGEEASEDILLNIHDTTFFKMRVKFSSHHVFKKKRISWSSTAIIDVTDECSGG